jgi:hypothetical protein
MMTLGILFDLLMLILFCVIFGAGIWCGRRVERVVKG